MQSLWRNTAYWFASCGLHSLFSYSPRTTIPPMTTSGLGSFTLVTNQENVPQTCPEANLVGYFLNRECLFQNDVAYAMLT